jgi:hypothetical protein
MNRRWLTATPARRAAVFLGAPAWIPLFAATIIAALVLYIVSTIIWCPVVQAVSWVRYGDRYVLGLYWWPLVADVDAGSEHDRATNAAREKLGMIPRVF